LAEKRIYEVVFIIDPATGEEDSTRLVENLQKIVTDQGGAITKSESMGRRQLAYRIGRNTEGHFMLFEIEGTGGEIAELERRMRVSDQVMRYLTVRVDEDRRRADKFRDRRARKASKRPEKGTGGRGGGGGNYTAPAAAPAAAAVAVADEEDGGA
jgi:small subunit ribosomal protein S6